MNNYSLGIWTITFINSKLDETSPFVWVFATKADWESGGNYLGTLSFIKVIQSGVSHTVGF